MSILRTRDKGDDATGDGSRLFDVQDRRHALPFRKTLLEFRHIILERPDFL